MLLLFLFLIFQEYSFYRGLLLSPFIYYLQQLFGFGLFALVLTVFIRDVRETTEITIHKTYFFVE